MRTKKCKRCGKIYEICGAEYVVESGRQRYCRACAADAVRDEVRRVKREYNASHPEVICKAREARKGCKVCPICGGAVPAGTARERPQERTETPLLAFL